MTSFTSMLVLYMNKACLCQVINAIFKFFIHITRHSILQKK